MGNSQNLINICILFHTWNARESTYLATFMRDPEAITGSSTGWVALQDQRTEKKKKSRKCMVYVKQSNTNTHKYVKSNKDIWP